MGISRPLELVQTSVRFLISRSKEGNNSREEGPLPAAYKTWVKLLSSMLLEGIRVDNGMMGLRWNEGRIV